MTRAVSQLCLSSRLAGCGLAEHDLPNRITPLRKPAEPLRLTSLPRQRAVDPLRTLARRAGAGDGEAIHALVMELSGPMLRTVRKVLGACHPDAEDVTQEAVFGLIRGLARFREESSVTHFAHQVALRSALHARRHFTVRDRVGTSDLDVPEPVDTSGRSPLEIAVSRERRRIVRGLLEHLPEPIAESLGLHFMLGYTVEEIASMVDVSPNTVWSRLRLGRKALRRALQNDARLNDLLRGERT